MSGGSYNYLFIKDTRELFGMYEELENISNRLAGLGYANDAARETEEIILILRQVENRIQARSSRLSNLWQAVEWWDSGDWSEDQVKKALEDYRKM